MITIDHGRRGPGPGRLRHVERHGRTTWTFDWTGADGRRHRQALSSDKRVAQMRATEIVRARDMRLAGLGAVAGQSMLLAELRDAYLTDLKTRVGRSQFVNARLRLAKMLDALPAQRVRDLRVRDALCYRAERVEAGASHRTANADVATLKAMLNWAVASQLIAQSPIQGIRRLPDGEAHQVCRRRAMTDAEIDAFLRAAADDDARNATSRRGVTESEMGPPQGTGLRSVRTPPPRIPQRPLWEFLLMCGPRYGETRQLAWGDVDLDSATVTLRAENTKSHRTRCVPIRREFVAELVRLRALHARALGRPVREGDLVFLSPDARPLRRDTTNVRRVFRRLLDAAGIDRVDQLGRKLDVHALRGTCATALARRGVGITVAQRLLGHSSPELTARHYVRTELDDLRAAVEPVTAPSAREASA